MFFSCLLFAEIPVTLDYDSNLVDTSYEKGLFTNWKHSYPHYQGLI